MLSSFISSPKPLTSAQYPIAMGLKYTTTVAKTSVFFPELNPIPSCLSDDKEIVNSRTYDSVFPSLPL